jgi:hypothetical protein
MTSSYKNEQHLSMTTNIPGRITPALINKWNTDFYREFYRRQAIQMKEWISDEAILQIAVMVVNSEESRGVPIREQQSLAQALEKGAKAKRFVLTGLAHKGGKAPKDDALNELIAQRLRKYPRMGVMQLLAELEGEVGAGVVTSIDNPSDLLVGDIPCLHYVNDNGKPKTASIPGLKDRLSRAKRKTKNSH